MIEKIILIVYTVLLCYAVFLFMFIFALGPFKEFKYTPDNKLPEFSDVSMDKSFYEMTDNEIKKVLGKKLYKFLKPHFDNCRKL